MAAKLHRKARGAAGWSWMAPAFALAACGGDSTPSADHGGSDELDRRCDLAPFPSELWTQCEAQNYAMAWQAPVEQAGSPEYLGRWHAQSTRNTLEWQARAAADPSWLSPLSGNSAATPLCATWGARCVGDPFRYPGVAGPDGDVFYEREAQVQPFVIYDDGCARLSGRVWRPRDAEPGAALPTVVIENGLSAPETEYWWIAQALVRAGYAVLTFDPRGQGRSDQQTPAGAPGGANSLASNLVNVIDFFRSMPAAPYPHNAACADAYPTAVTEFNPYWDHMDSERLGLIGHSLGAQAVSIVQGYGGAGAEPWPGRLDTANPVKVVVVWDGLVAPDGASDNGAGGSLPLPGQSFGELPAFGIRVPAMNQSSDYGLAPTLFVAPADAEAHKAAFRQWAAAGVPAYSLTIQGGTHYDWSPRQGNPATSWCPDASGGFCAGGWGLPMSQHYTVAWLDRG